jgi:hypothetical protein
MISASVPRRRSDFSAKAANSLWIKFSVESAAIPDLTFCSDLTVCSACGMISEFGIAAGAGGACLVSPAWDGVFEGSVA